MQRLESIAMPANLSSLGEEAPQTLAFFAGKIREARERRAPVPVKHFLLRVAFPVARSVRARSSAQCSR
jgi:hypothetical protein